MNELITTKPAVLLLVDYQERLMPSVHDGATVLAQAKRLADVAQVLGVYTLGTEQNPRGLGPNVAALRQRCATTLAKMHFDACEDGLLALLDQGPVPAGPMQRAAQVAAPTAPPPRELVIAGCEAHVCLLQTSLGLLRAGWRLWLVADACGSRRASDHALAMARLREAGAHLVSTEMVVFEWLRSCEHPRFKAVLPLLKATAPTSL